MKDILISYFKAPITNINKPSNIGLLEIANLIRSDKELRSNIYKVRFGGMDKTKLLDNVTFSGLFERRRREDLKEYSGFICIDIDKIDNPEKLKQDLIKSELPVVLSFISPSGNGLKVVLKSCSDINKHLSYFNYYEEYFKTKYDIQIDKACKDISRTCFLSHDREVYYIDPNEVKEIELTNCVHPILDFARQFILESKDGEKHTRLRNISFLLGGYCSAGLIEANKALDCLKESIVKRGNLTSKTNAFITIDKSFTNGLEFPISEEDSNSFLSVDYKNKCEETIGINIPKEIDDRQVNMVYTKHLFNSIPSLVKDIIDKFSYGDNSTVLLFTFLSTASGLFPKIKFEHSMKEYSLNLTSIIVAPPASFKSDALLIKSLFLKIEKHLREIKPEGKKKSKCFFMSFNISDSEVYNRLEINDGAGVFFDTEISSLTSTSSKEWGNKLSTTIRQVSMNEEISKLRVGDDEDVLIDFPCVSTFITGTDSQLEGLFKSNDDGTYSRFMFMSIIRETIWRRGLISKKRPDITYEQDLLFDIYKHYQEHIPIIDIPDEVEKYYDDKFEEILEEYKQDSLITSVVYRHGLFTLKIACILKLLERKWLLSETVVIDKETIDTALYIIKCSIVVASNISFNLDYTPVSNEIRLIRKISLLNREFTIQEAVKMCEHICSRATVYRIIKKSNRIKYISNNKYKIIAE